GGRASPVGLPGSGRAGPRRDPGVGDRLELGREAVLEKEEPDLDVGGEALGGGGGAGREAVSKGRGGGAEEVDEPGEIGGRRGGPGGLPPVVDEGEPPPGLLVGVVEDWHWIASQRSWKGLAVKKAAPICDGMVTLDQLRAGVVTAEEAARYL